MFNLIGLATRALRNAGMDDKAEEMTNRAFTAGSYGEVLVLLGEYVEIR